jgi:hypothetical protein
MLLKIIFESIQDKLKHQYPSYSDTIDKLDNAQINPKYFKWIIENIQKKPEPIEDIIPILKKFIKIKDNLVQKDLIQYKDIHSVRQSITEYELKKELKGKSLENYKDAQEKIKTEQSTKIYEDSEWIVVFPHSTDSSIAWCSNKYGGSNTQWCTAASKSQNLFLSYTARNENFFLFYCINKNQDPKINPNAYISLGFNKKGIPFFGQDGGVTVNAANSGLNEINIKSILGIDRYEEILNKIQNFINKQIEHPSKQEMINILSDINKFKKHYERLKGEEKIDFRNLVLEEYNNVNAEIIKYFLIKEKSNPEKLIDILNNANKTNNRSEIIDFTYKLLKSEYPEIIPGYVDVFKFFLKNKNTPEYIIDEILNFAKYGKHNQYPHDYILTLLENYFYNPNVNPKKLYGIYEFAKTAMKDYYDQKEEYETFIDYMITICKNESLEVQRDIINEENFDLLYSVTKTNNNEILIKLLRLVSKYYEEDYSKIEKILLELKYNNEYFKQTKEQLIKLAKVPPLIEKQLEIFFSKKR